MEEAVSLKNSPVPWSRPDPDTPFEFVILVTLWVIEIQAANKEVIYYMCAAVLLEAR